MTELDFDELDKAVNSLMTESGAGETSATPEASTHTTPSAAKTASTPATRRRGQFMDVMHPSSNMRQSPTPVTHQALDVTPPTISGAVTTDATPAPDETSLAPVADVAAEPLVVEPDSTVTAPAQEVNDMLIGDVTSPEEAVEVESTSSHDQMQAEDPLTSPFLPDAKVEKRPLGEPVPYVEPALDTTTTDAEPITVVAEGEAEHTEQPEVDDGDMGAVEPTPLPDELKQDVVAVEANEVIHDAPIETSTIGDLAQETIQPVNGAIAQQYEEQPSTGEMTNGAIYDTDTYHQPLEAHPAKKKSSVLTWILWTIVLLIVGATAGAAWFYFTTQ